MWEEEPISAAAGQHEPFIAHYHNQAPSLSEDSRRPCASFICRPLYLTGPGAVCPPAGSCTVRTALCSCQPPTPEQRRHLPLTLRRSKVIDQRIQAAADGSDTEGEQVRLVGTVAGVVGQKNVVDHEDDVGGGEADHKHHQHQRGHDHSSGLFGTVVHVGGGQSLDDAHVKDHGEDKRDEEEDGGVDGEKVDVVNLQEVWILHVVAGGDVQVGQMQRLFGDQERRDSAQGQHPHGTTDRPGRLRAAPRQRLYGVNHSQETVDADTHDEQDGAIHVAIEGGCDNSAQEGAIDPVVAMEIVGDLEGKEEAQEEVCAGQV